MILTFNYLTWKSVEIIHSPAGATSVLIYQIYWLKIIEHTTLALHIDQEIDRLVQIYIPSLLSSERHKYIILVYIRQQTKRFCFLIWCNTYFVNVTPCQYFFLFHSALIINSAFHHEFTIPKTFNSESTFTALEINECKRVLRECNIIKKTSWRENVFSCARTCTFGNFSKLVVWHLHWNYHSPWTLTSKLTDLEYE